VLVGVSKGVFEERSNGVHQDQGKSLAMLSESRCHLGCPSCDAMPCLQQQNGNFRRDLM